MRTALEQCAVKEEDEGEDMKRSTVVVNIVSRSVRPVLLCIYYDL